MKRIVLFICLLSATVAQGQVYRYLSTEGETAWARGGLRIGGVIYFPTGTTLPTIPSTLTNNPALIVVGEKVYRWSPSTDAWVDITGFSGAWGSITGNIGSQTDLQTALGLKQNVLPTGTTSQYFRGDKTLGNFATDVKSAGDVLYSTLDTSIAHRQALNLLHWNTYQNYFVTGVSTKVLYGVTFGGVTRKLADWVDAIADSTTMANTVTSFNTRTGDIIPQLADYSAYFATTNHTHVFADLLSKPTTLTGYGITDAVPSSRTITINGQTFDLSQNRSWTITEGGASYTDAQARAAISLTTTGTSGAATYNSSTGVLNIPNYTTSGGGNMDSAFVRMEYVNDSTTRFYAKGGWYYDLVRPCETGSGTAGVENVYYDEATQTLKQTKNGVDSDIAIVAAYNFTNPQVGQLLAIGENNTIVNTTATGGSDSLTISTIAPETTNHYFNPTDTSYNVRYGTTWFKFKPAGSSAVIPEGPGGTETMQNWDGVTPPAIPAGWTLAGAGKTYTEASFGQGLTNGASNAIDGAWLDAIEETGTVTVSHEVRYRAGVAETILIAKSTTKDWSTMNGYAVDWMQGNGGFNGIMLKKKTPTYTDLSARIGGSNIDEGADHRITLTVTSAAVITVKVQRLTDSYWLNSAGNYQAGEAAAISYTDTDSPITAAGYNGVIFYNTASEGSVSDNFKRTTN